VLISNTLLQKHIDDYIDRFDHRIDNDPADRPLIPTQVFVRGSFRLKIAQKQDVCQDCTFEASTIMAQCVL